MASKDSAPLGMRQIFAIGRRSLMGCPARDAVRSAEKMKKGNREGIKDFMQIAIPSAAP